MLPKGGVIVKGEHVENRADGSTYEDKTRKDVRIFLEYKNAGKMPANSTMRKYYLSYQGQGPMLIKENPAQISISPVQPLTDMYDFMILKDYSNNFILEVEVHYYGRKLLGWFFAGRSYIHRCRIHFIDGIADIEEAIDVR